MRSLLRKYLNYEYVFKSSYVWVIRVIACNGKTNFQAFVISISWIIQLLISYYFFQRESSKITKIYYKFISTWKVIRKRSRKDSCSGKIFENTKFSQIHRLVTFWKMNAHALFCVWCYHFGIYSIEVPWAMMIDKFFLFLEILSLWNGGSERISRSYCRRYDEPRISTGKWIKNYSMLVVLSVGNTDTIRFTRTTTALYNFSYAISSQPSICRERWYLRVVCPIRSRSRS